MRFALLRYVPQRLRTLERCVRMIRLNPNNLLYVPEEHCYEAVLKGNFLSYEAVLKGNFLNDIRALMEWSRWYFRIHHLDEILKDNESKDTWELARKYATRESMMAHPQGRRYLLEQDMDL